MLFRYDFGEQLDLSRFCKQAKHHISAKIDIAYHLCTKDYRILAEISAPEGSRHYQVKLCIQAISRDIDGEICDKTNIFPMDDIRFKSFKEIQELFIPGCNDSLMLYHSTQQIVNNLASLIRIIHKINHLKAFI